MSEENVLHTWKRESVGQSNVVGTLFTKTDMVGEASSSSSLSISGPSNIPTEMLPPQQQLELQKISSISKINSITKISGLESVTQMPEKDRLRKIQQIVEAGIGDHAKQQILQILDKISLLKPPERLLLYLRMPGGTPETDPLRQPQNPLGTRSEINHTINWVRSHLEHDPKVSIPKQDVYNDYVAYCERVDIKPLSTADFGKVMKQVFPEIRPRRLGTRGHSRYCYAAMRKATKLNSPRLPDLGVSGNVSDYSNTDEDSWKIIKLWVEGLLNSTFDSLKDLATHITKHNLNSPATNSSRLLLQKKLLQKDLKEKRKFSDTGPLKKRRKKKRKTSSSSESVQQTATLPAEISLADTIKCIKTEIVDPSHSNQSQVQSSVVTQLPSQQMLPMNLVTDQDNNNLRKMQGTNLACDNTLVVGCTAKSLVAQNISSLTGTTGVEGDCKAATIPQNLIKPELNVIKEEIPDDYHSNILCKKVRQAQQAKGLWNPLPNVNTTTVSQALIPAVDHQNMAPAYNRVTHSLMGPPAQLDLPADTLNSGGFKRTTSATTVVGSSNCVSGGNSVPKSSSPHLPLRAKKLRYINTRLEAMNEIQQQSNTIADTNVDKDVLPDNLGIPRERVISICNMDKHELDDYLNEEENSQDQEAELLQYFQTDDADNKSEEIENVNENAGIQQNAFPILENYQLYGNAKGERKPAVQNDLDEITQLRYYLHQNLQSSINNNNNNNNNSKDIDGTTVQKSATMDPSGNYPGLYTGGSASASLALMSQRHLAIVPEDPINLRCCTNSNVTNNNVQNSNNSALRGPRRKINLNARSCVPNSPNTRRKNFSFVPISPNTNNNNNSIDFSPFISPRSTPAIRKPPLHKQNSLPICEQSIADPMIGAQGSSSFGKAITFQSTISASAPPSPSLVQHRFRFTPSTTSGPLTTMSLSNGRDQQFNQLQSLALQCRNQNSNSLDGVSESRSQSVPLHCRNSPAFNHSNNFAGFSSACSSVGQTPVPPDFNDFSDPTSILDIFADATQHQPVKLESSDIDSSLLVDADIGSNESDLAMGDILSAEFASKGGSSVNNLSRSVPSTPLPIIGYKCNNTNLSNQDPGKINKVYDISKSVPTTPVAMNVAPFRYSPEMNRDFLINGNTIESGKINSFYSNQQQSQQQPSQSNATVSVTDKVIPTSLPEGIDELSNFGVVTESIIGSDILNNI